MDSLPPIPTPLPTRLREMRAVWTPVVVFLLSLAGAVGLWRQNVLAPRTVGEAEIITANVAAPSAGSLAELKVSRYDHVAAGDILAHVITTDPRIVEASLAVIRAEVQLLRVNSEPLLRMQRNEIAYESLRLDWLNERTELATSRVNLQYAETEYQRLLRLHQDKLVSDDILEQSQRNRDALAVEVKEKERMVSDLEPSLETWRANGKGTNSAPGQEAMTAAINVQEEKLRLTEAHLKPVALIAPIDGVVTTIFRRNGESLSAGDNIVAITSEHSNHVVAYLRQPLTFEPQKGQPVEIRTRSSRHEMARSEIVAVGSSWENIARPLLRTGPNAANELGLPFLVSLPPSLNVRPGELLDLTILPREQ